jgi:poly(3-hydroxybutyrate) depolymerase
VNPVQLVILVLVAVLTVGIHPIRVSVLEWLSRSDNAEATGLARTVQCATSTGRQGAYYLPAGYESRTLPLLVFFHGTGGAGASAILRLRMAAEQGRFIVLAPDSVSVAGVWMIGVPSKNSFVAINLHSAE